MQKPLISFDYAIKYLLKDKGDYEIVGGFISALLKAKGEIKKDVKIIALLDTESNKEDNIYKRSLADVIVEDEDHNKYIVEIERSIQQGFVHKACFNTSRLIVDNLSPGSDFSDIIKVIHISILYFPVGEEPIHHGETIFKGVESKKRLSIQIKDPLTGNITDTTNIFPEYFFISIPLFDGRLEKEIDDWLYVMKNDDVPENFHSPYMEKVRERLAILKMTVEERNRYFAYKKQVFTDRDIMSTARQEGLEEGLQKGREEGLQKGLQKGKAEGEKNKALEIARGMISEGLSTDLIFKVTGLSEKEIRELENFTLNT
ncbi:MAG: Rpn family recombination-promoting nuclease/putative transposase [Candidatus Jidaibacter sp.]|jgi:predicted transposase/invertase (TIGR01784 family)|nr:Rpn family recombination-promoting nuclease/putative transposase [Candidatus Jidaibacter sp.]